MLEELKWNTGIPLPKLEKGSKVTTEALYWEQLQALDRPFVAVRYEKGSTTYRTIYGPIPEPIVEQKSGG